jgi:hypothetical protein
VLSLLKISLVSISLLSSELPQVHLQFSVKLGVSMLSSQLQPKVSPVFSHSLSRFHFPLVLEISEFVSPKHREKPQQLLW